MAKKAKALGVKIALMTIYPDSTLGKLVDIVVHIPASLAKATGERSGFRYSREAICSEQSMLLFRRRLGDLSGRPGRASIDRQVHHEASRQLGIKSKRRRIYETFCHRY